MTMAEPIQILVADDELPILETVSITLSSAGYEVTTVESAKEALVLLGKVGSAKFKLLIPDYSHLPMI